MAGAVLAIGAAVSAGTKNQVIAFVVTAALVFVLAVAGTPTVLGLLQGWAPSSVIRAVAGASLFGHFTAITRGVVDLRDVVYFLSIMVAFLAANAIIIDLNQADCDGVLWPGHVTQLARLDRPALHRVGAGRRRH